LVRACCTASTLSNILLERFRLNSKNHLSTGLSSGEYEGSFRRLMFSGSAIAPERWEGGVVHDDHEMVLGIRLAQLP
jgi:hypothetical protein